ncbi:gluconate:H+ symporter [Clostridium arbusti]|uniref:gluconate:H+ symporter n=1 Tax=Clostridium arbusti TaxID=1137848 RepID=UPI0002889359|nr:gluconate:H+ symporter [Clostridium arbusti]
MPLIIVCIGIAILLVLIMFFKVNAFVSLIITALIVGYMEGMSILTITKSIENGVGSTLGYLGLILGFGAIFGKLMAECGAAQRIATKLIDKFGKKHVQIAIVLTSFIVGIALFYEVGIVLLLPIIFTIAVYAEVPPLTIGISAAAALSATHGFLPPHPGATTIAVIYKADIGLTLLYGIIIAIPAALLGGPFLARFLKNFNHEIPKDLFNKKMFKEEEMPSFIVSVITALIPVILMTLATIGKMVLTKKSSIQTIFEFIGDPVIALLIALIIGFFIFGINRGKNMNEVGKTAVAALSGIAMIVFIIAGGGAFKQVLMDSGVGNYIVKLVQGTNISPIFLAWLIASLIRIAQGSATVAAITAAGIMLPIIQVSHVSPELMVLATGAGSLIFPHVNDTGFWMFKEFFNLSVPETFASFTLMDTILSFVGLAGALILNAIIY